MSLEKINRNELREKLASANIPTLLVTMAHITGDMALLDNQQKPSRGDIDGIRKMSKARQQEIIETAVVIIGDFLDATGAVPTPLAMPSETVLEHMASTLVGEPVPSEYIPMMLEDMGFTDSAISRVQWADASSSESSAPDANAASAVKDSKVLIIGGGLSGLCMAIQLQRLGIDFELIEKNDSLAGTWYENTYPDCGVDTPNHFYSFSFAPNHQWTSFYSKRDELYAYICNLAEEYGIYAKTRLNTEVTKMTWQEESKSWQIGVRDKQGVESQQQVPFVFTAVGHLNRAKVPDFPGKEDFAGPNFHSAQWRHDVDLTGKKVAVIGTGASAMQLAPVLAKSVSQLTIFQRSPHWIRILSDYHRKVGDGKQWLLENIPFYRNWYRFKLFWAYGDGIWESIHKDPSWPHADRSLNADNERHRNAYIKNLSDALNGNEALLAKVVPDYPPFAKRMLIDNHWCDMLQQDHVDLVTSDVSKITKSGVVDDQGIEHPVDAIIYATGFHAHKFMWPMEIVGASGATLEDTWGDDARAYMGMTTPDFPNMFFLYGPNTGLGHGGSLIFHVECQTRYLAQCLMRTLEAGKRKIEVKSDINAAYNQRVDDEHERMVWTHTGVTNWYKNSQGRVVSNSPWRLVDYWHMTHSPDMSDYKLS